jgi:putative transposase
MIKLDPKIIKYFKGYNNSAEIIMTCLYFKFRYSLSYRDIEELCEMRGLNIDHSNIQRWVEKFTPLLNKRFRTRKHNVNNC